MYLKLLILYIFGVTYNKYKKLLNLTPLNKTIRRQLKTKYYEKTKLNTYKH